MLRKLSLISITALAVALIGDRAFAASAEDFYRGKTIRFVVGFAAGGGFDTYTRLIARHFGKHVPGNPSTVVDNMDGAGSLIAANHIFNKADPDGLTIGNWIGPLVLQQVMGNKATRFDGRKFNYLGIPTPDSGVCALTKASGINTLDDWFASKRPIKLGGTAPGSTTDDVPKLVAQATGLPTQMIEGYKGTSRIRVAAESGELDGGCWAWQSIKPTWAKGLESGNIRIVLQTMLKSHAELKHIPLAINHAKSEEGKKLLQVVNDAYGEGARPYTLPPGVPADRVALLQKAFMETLHDSELLAEAKKAKLEIDPIDGPTATKIFQGFFDYEPAVINKIKEIVLPGKR
jgi:tripartite-type tricarboxylate transporter receptor subunit TctC